MIEIVNVRTYRGSRLDPWVVYVGRRNRELAASPLGNPFTVEQWGRGVAIPKFGEWLQQQIGQTPRTAADLELDRLLGIWRAHGRLVLMCWCAPKPCHAQLIADEVHRRAAGPQIFDLDVEF